MKNIFNSILSRVNNCFARKVSKRKDRIIIKPFHHISIQINDKKYKILNISVNGIAILSENDFEVKEMIEAQIQIGEFNINSTFEVSRITGNVVGAKIIKNSIQFENVVKAYFLSEIKGKELLKLNTKILKSPTSGNPVLFYGDENYELYYITEKNIINFLQLVYKGYVIGSSKSGDNIYIGKLKSDEEFEKIAHKGSSLVDFDVEIPEKIYDEINRFIHSIVGIPVDEFNQILDILYRLEKFPRN